MNNSARKSKYHVKKKKKKEKKKKKGRKKENGKFISIHGGKKIWCVTITQFPLPTTAHILKILSGTFFFTFIKGDSFSQ